MVHNGVEAPPPTDEAARRTLRHELQIADDDVAILFLGQLDERKGPETAALAVSRLREEGLPVVLLMAGEGPLAADLASHTDHGVRLLGLRPDPDRLLDACDIFVTPSLREGLSFAVIEAMAHAPLPRGVRWTGQS